MSQSRIAVCLLAVLTTVSAHAGLHVSVDAGRSDAGGNVPLRVTVRNVGGVAAPGVSVRTQVGGRTGFEAAGWTCTESAASIDCTLDRGVLAPGESSSVEVSVGFGSTFARRIVFASASYQEGSTARGASTMSSVARRRRFVVTQPTDQGAGSLRAAIESMNVDIDCLTMPCAIEFEIPNGTDTLTHIIAPRTPLPRLTAQDVAIDGRSQTALGDTNPAGPEIALIGSQLEVGHGVDFFTRIGEVRALAIGGFPWNGINFQGRDDGRRGTLVVAGNYIGTNPNGAAALPNFRGIGIVSRLNSDSRISGNTISGNTRSGIFDWTEHEPAGPIGAVLSIEYNRIGVAAGSDIPLGNGASAIFFGPDSDGALIVGNTIAFNRDFAIAISRAARQVKVLANSIVSNGAAIDVGLDGPTPTISPSPTLRISATITSALYDPATNTTTIKGDPGVVPNIVTDLLVSATVALYANDAREHGEYAEAQHYLGDAVPDGASSFTFTFTYAGDLRGKFITALAHRALMLSGSEFFDVAELSKAVEVH
jgi:hypothetical protein